MPCVNGELTFNKNLIKNPINSSKTDNVDKLIISEKEVEPEETSVFEKETEKVIIQEEIVVEVEPELSNYTTEVTKEEQDLTIEEPQIIEETTEKEPIIIKEEKPFNSADVIKGFEEAKGQIKNLYDTIFGYGDKFKPTYQDTVGDLLSYIGGLSTKLNANSEYTRVFGVDTANLCGKYLENDYIPYAFKISVWSYKNKAKNNVYNLLNGLIECLFALAYKFDSNTQESTVYGLILPVIKYLESNQIKLN